MMHHSMLHCFSSIGCPCFHQKSQHWMQPAACWWTAKCMQHAELYMGCCRDASECNAWTWCNDEQGCTTEDGSSIPRSAQQDHAHVPQLHVTAAADSFLGVYLQLIHLLSGHGEVFTVSLSHGSSNFVFNMALCDTVFLCCQVWLPAEAGATQAVGRSLPGSHHPEALHLCLRLCQTCVPIADRHAVDTCAPPPTKRSLEARDGLAGRATFPWC